MSTQATPTAFSGTIPANYDQYLGPMFFQPFAQDMAARVKAIKPRQLLELAAGTGRVTALLPDGIAADGRITATDINPAMVAYGKQTIDHPAVTWELADAVSLPYADNSFDLVVVQFGVMFYSDRIAAYREALRVLNPGGMMLFNCWDKIDNNPMPQIANEALEYYFPVDTPKFYSIPFSYFDEALIRAELKEAGFAATEITLLHLTGESRSATDAAKGLIEGTPTITAIQERDASLVGPVLEFVEQKVRVRFGEGAIEVPLAARMVQTKK